MSGRIFTAFAISPSGQKWYMPSEKAVRDWWRCFHCGGVNPNKDDDNETVWKCQNCSAPKKEDDKE